MKTLVTLALVLMASLALAADSTSPLPELKPVKGKPVSMWFEFRTGDFAGASQIWGEVRNDSQKPLTNVRVAFESFDKNDKRIGTSSDTVAKLAPGETWSFEIHPKETGVRIFKLKDVEIH